MTKYYKNIKGKDINLILYGLGEVKIPANAKCMELDEAVVNAINNMAYPDTILEQVEPKITVEIKENVEVELEEINLDVIFEEEKDEEIFKVKAPTKRIK